MVLEQGIPHNLLQTFKGIAIVKNETILGGEAWLSGNNTRFPMRYIREKVHSQTKGFHCFEGEVHPFYLGQL